MYVYVYISLLDGPHSAWRLANLIYMWFNSYKFLSIDVYLCLTNAIMRKLRWKFHKVMLIGAKHM